MIDVLNNISHGDAFIITAPPGWGKTYKLLSAIKSVRRTVIFIFPLRALCDEVYLSALRKKIDVINIRSRKDYELLSANKFQLVLMTPEVYWENHDWNEYTVIFDEFHLFYYWGESFRERMLEVYREVLTNNNPVIFLTATLGENLKDRLVEELENNYENIYQLDVGNQQLKNPPERTYWYPKLLRNWMVDDFCYSDKTETALIFCQFRNQVKVLEDKLTLLGFRVLSCVGGEADVFISKLQNIGKLDFIIATSVVSHGVNLPQISNIYLTYPVENIDFYLQMLGRGGREGNSFNIHIFNTNYFSPKQLAQGFFNIFLKRLSNKINSLLY